MAKGITLEMAKAAYQASKEVYDGRMSRGDAVDSLGTEHKIHEASVSDFILRFKRMMEGKKYPITGRPEHTDYFLTQILKDYGTDKLSNAIKAVEAHVNHEKKLGRKGLKGTKDVIGEHKKILRRHAAGFGKRIECWVVGLMLKEGIDVYMPLVGDNAIDAVIRKEDGTFIEVQIKARSKNIVMGDAALFTSITHEYRKNYYFVFWSERLETFWVMSSEEFIKWSSQNKSGKHIGERSIWFNGKRKNKQTGEYEEHCYEKFNKYIAEDFSRFKS